MTMLCCSYKLERFSIECRKSKTKYSLRPISKNMNGKFIEAWTNRNWKQIHAVHAKREKTCAGKSLWFWIHFWVARAAKHRNVIWKPLNSMITDHTCNDMRTTHSYFSFRCFELGSLAAELCIKWPDGKWLEFRVHLSSATKIAIELTASGALSRLLGKTVKPAQPKTKSFSQRSICVARWTINDCPRGCEKPQGQWNSWRE